MSDAGTPSCALLAYGETHTGASEVESLYTGHFTFPKLLSPKFSQQQPRLLELLMELQG